jgi:hypothetical protein
MKSRTFLILIAAFVSGALNISLGAQSAPTTYAQYLVNQTLAKHPDVLVLALHVTPPNRPDNIIIASNIGRIGKQADEDDLRVIKTGKYNLAVNKNGDRFEVELPLQDGNRNTIGALGVVFPYKPGDDKTRRQQQAEQIRDDLRRRIIDLANLVEAYPYDPQYSSDTYGQKLIGDVMDRHPQILILAMHVTPPKAEDNVIIASNFGRIGKKSDEGDLVALKTGKDRMEVNKNGEQFRGQLVLRDVSGEPIGTLALAIPYKQGEDKALLLKQAEEIRDELQRRTSNAGNLMEPYPFVSEAPTDSYAQRLVEETMAQHPELLILVMHVTPPNGKENVIIGSSIGRLGKKADEDDMRVIETGKTNLEVNSGGNRFEAELQLHDRSGRVIGALGTVFAYKDGDDKARFQKLGETIRDGIEKRIPSLEKLMEPVR